MSSEQLIRKKRRKRGMRVKQKDGGTAGEQKCRGWGLVKGSVGIIT